MMRAQSNADGHHGTCLLRAPRIEAGPARRRVVLGLIATSVFMTGCIGLLQSLVPTTAPPSTSDTVGLELVAADLTSPLSVVEPNDGTDRLFIVDQVGLVHIVDPVLGVLTTPFLDVRSKLVTLQAAYDERGLLDMAFHPNFPADPRLYVCYNAPLGPNDPTGFDCVWRIAEYQVSASNADQADPNSERILLDVPQPQANHNGGQLAFGPNREYLFASLGDGGSANDTGFGHTPDLGNAQDISNLLGSILRIGVEPDGASPYTVPTDNPLVGVAGARPEIWAFGLRNPYRFSFYMGGTNRLFAGDVGEQLIEEVNIIVKGGNYGWNIKEGTNCFDPDNPSTPLPTCASTGARGEPLIDPIIEYSHTDNFGNTVGISVICGYVYRGTAIPALTGLLVFGDFTQTPSSADGVLFLGEEMPDGSWERREVGIATTANGRLNGYLLGFGQDLDGEVYVCLSQNIGPSGSTGSVHKIVPAP